MQAVFSIVTFGECSVKDDNKYTDGLNKFRGWGLLGKCIFHLPFSSTRNWIIILNSFTYSSITQFTQISVVPCPVVSGGADIQVEHASGVSPHMERARMDDRGQEYQREQAGTSGIGVVLHKPKRNVKQLEWYGFEEMMSNILVIANRDPYTYEEAMKSQDKER